LETGNVPKAELMYNMYFENREISTVREMQKVDVFEDIFRYRKEA
jgi:hypothetical protein